LSCWHVGRHVNRKKRKMIDVLNTPNVRIRDFVEEAFGTKCKKVEDYFNVGGSLELGDGGAAPSQKEFFLPNAPSSVFLAVVAWQHEFYIGSTTNWHKSGFRANVKMKSGADNLVSISQLRLNVANQQVNQNGLWCGFFTNLILTMDSFGVGGVGVHNVGFAITGKLITFADQVFYKNAGVPDYASRLAI
jgi:hypothetical protein